MAQLARLDNLQVGSACTRFALNSAFTMPETSTNTRILDHIVHLTPPGSVEATSNQFRELGFTVVPGGTHTGGLTANALVILADGVYLELISFTHPASYYPPGSSERVARDSNPWSSKSPGWIDFAFLGNGSLTNNRISDVINQRGRREGSGVIYNSEIAGGRQRPDGRVLKWVISAPATDRGTLPFFCGDVTPRDWRVPSDPPSNTQHSSTASGVAHVLLVTSFETFTSLSNQLTTVIGSLPVHSTEIEVIWKLEATHGGAKTGPRLILKTADSSKETTFVEEVETGIFEVAFFTEGKEGHADTPYGRIAWVPI